MKIQEALSNCCQSVQSWGSKAVTWFGKSVSNITTTFGEYARKGAELAKPYFQNAQNFLSQNKPYVWVATVAFGVGAVFLFLINKVCCNTTTKPAQL